MRSDGQLHLCDFDDASIEGDGHVTTGMTFPYCSPFRIQNMEAPKRLTDDLYATGLLVRRLLTYSSIFFHLLHADLGNIYRATTVNLRERVKRRPGHRRSS
jgi:hypothetical protein